MVAAIIVPLVILVQSVIQIAKKFLIADCIKFL
jgi:hypothetical protein